MDNHPSEAEDAEPSAGCAPKLAWKILEEEYKAIIKRLEDHPNDYSLDDIAEIAEETPPEIHKQKWLDWARKQEDSPCKGGVLLAGEKGMGMTIALVRDKHERGLSLPTLVVCNSKALSKWEEEIERQGVKVVTYRGRLRREMSDCYISKHVFVLTTYETAGIDLPCEFCGAEVDRQGKKSHGPLLCASSENQRKPLLSSAKWERIILDESLAIKSMKNSSTKAVLGFNSKYRWALPRTPLDQLTIENESEIYSLIRFLRVYPYAYFFCRLCDSRSLHSLKSCPSHVGHVSAVSWWDMFIKNPSRYPGAERRRAGILLRRVVLKSIMLKSTKECVGVLPPCPPTQEKKQSSLEGEYGSPTDEQGNSSPYEMTDLSK